MAKRFFSKSSFWNQPICDARTDLKSDQYMGLLAQEPNGPFGINLEKWTVPVFEVDQSVPRRKVSVRTYTDQELTEKGSKWVGVGDRFGHFPDFANRGVPVPDYAQADPAGDAHMAIVDWTRNMVWDMWAVKRDKYGNFSSNTGMSYRLSGEGVFMTSDFPVKDGESIHFYGPSRAAGVPAIAGLIMHDEVAEGGISHRLACATRYNAYKEFVYPACWTDGYCDGGIPEGAVIQLDPDLDIGKFDLTAGERIVAKALQEYGAVNVDNAGGTSLYAEGLWARPGKSWHGILTNTGLMHIPVDHYRVLELGEVTRMGDSKRSAAAKNPSANSS